MTVAVAHEPETHGHLAVTDAQVDWTPEQDAALATIGLADCPSPQRRAFLHLCQRTMLDPFLKQIYLINRGGKWQPQTSIDGFRIIAGRNPEYVGQTHPQWCGPDGRWTDVWLDDTVDPVAARVGVHHAGYREPIYMVALFREFKQSSSPKWRRNGEGGMPVHMLAKVAEAGALRKAFPHDMSGLYTDDELDNAGGARRAARRRGAAGVTVEQLTSPSAASSAEAADTAPEEERISRAQLGRVRAAFDDAKVAESGDRQRVVSALMDRDVTDLRDLSSRDGATLLGYLAEQGARGIAALAGRGDTAPPAEVDADAEWAAQVGGDGS